MRGSTLSPEPGLKREVAPEDDREDDRPVDAAPPPESPAGSVRIALLESSQANQREDRADDPPHRTTWTGDVFSRSIRRGAAPATSALPHSLQNLAVSSTEVPQFGQMFIFSGSSSNAGKLGALRALQFSRSPALARRAPRGLTGGLASGLLAGASVGLAGGAEAEAEGDVPVGGREAALEGGQAVPGRAVPAAAAVDAVLAIRC